MDAERLLAEADEQHVFDFGLVPRKALRGWRCGRRSIGKPYAPVEIDGKAIDFRPCSTASLSEFDG